MKITRRGRLVSTLTILFIVSMIVWVLTHTEQNLCKDKTGKAYQACVDLNYP